MVMGTVDITENISATVEYRHCSTYRFQSPPHLIEELLEAGVEAKEHGSGSDHASKILLKGSAHTAAVAFAFCSTATLVMTLLECS